VKMWALFAASVAVIAVLLASRVTSRPHDIDPKIARVQLQALGQTVETFRADTGGYPAALAELTEHHGHGPYVAARDLRDPWGREFGFRRSPEGNSFVLSSLGADGETGGVGPGSDYSVLSPTR
jgi:general secretion pathway protein G